MAMMTVGGLMSVGAAEAYSLMAVHFDGCTPCQQAGAELAQLNKLCPEGRQLRKSWELAELRELERRRAKA